MTSSVTAVRSLDEAIDKGFRFCVTDVLVAGLVATYPKLGPFIVPSLNGNALEAMDSDVRRGMPPTALQLHLGYTSAALQVALPLFSTKPAPRAAGLRRCNRPQGFLGSKSLLSREAPLHDQGAVS